MSSACLILEVLREQLGDFFLDPSPGQGFEMMMDKGLRCSITIRYSDNRLIVDSLGSGQESWHFMLDDPAGVEAAIELTRQLLTLQSRTGKTG